MMTMMIISGDDENYRRPLAQNPTMTRAIIFVLSDMHASETLYYRIHHHRPLCLSLTLSFSPSTSS